MHTQALHLAVLLTSLACYVSNAPYKPPVTISVMGACVACYLGPWLPGALPELLPSRIHDGLQPFLVLQQGEWARLLTAAFVHTREAHLYYNLSTLLWRGLELERLYGSSLFALLLLELLLLTHGTAVLLAAAAARWLPGYWPLYAKARPVGLSGLNFALSVVTAYRPGAPPVSSFFELRLPTKYMALAELMVAARVNPHESLVVHIAGVLVGAVHAKLFEPVARALAGAALRAARGRDGTGAPVRAATAPAAAAAPAAASAQVPPLAPEPKPERSKPKQKPKPKPEPKLESKPEPKPEPPAAVAAARMAAQAAAARAAATMRTPAAELLAAGAEDATARGAAAAGAPEA